MLLLHYYITNCNLSQPFAKISHRKSNSNCLHHWCEWSWKTCDKGLVHHLVHQEGNITMAGTASPFLTNKQSPSPLRLNSVAMKCTDQSITFHWELLESCSAILLPLSHQQLHVQLYGIGSAVQDSRSCDFLSAFFAHVGNVSNLFRNLPLSIWEQPLCDKEQLGYVGEGCGVSENTWTYTSNLNFQFQF